MAYKLTGEVFGHPQEIRSFKEDSEWVLPHTLVGIELELEGFKKRPDLPKFSSYWVTHDEPSIRAYDNLRAYELVFSLPLSGYDLTRALSELPRVLESTNSVPIISRRTGFHVHLDVRDLPVNLIYNFIIVYLIFERLLFSYCGKTREDNLFCLPFYKASFIYDMLSFENTTKSLQNLSLEQYRYNALNLASLRRFGTLEFRQHPGTYSVPLIQTWINIIMCLKKFVLTYNNSAPVLLQIAQKDGFTRFTEMVFGNYKNLFSFPDGEQLFQQGLRDASEVIIKSALKPLHLKLGENPSNTINKRLLPYVKAPTPKTKPKEMW